MHRVHIYTHASTHTDTHTHACTHTHAHTHMHVHAHTHTHAYTQVYTIYVTHILLTFAGTKACGSTEEASEFLADATLLRSMRHPNLLSVLGLNSDDHKVPIVIYPHPDSLHTFLTSHKGDSTNITERSTCTHCMLAHLLC